MRLKTLCARGESGKKTIAAIESEAGCDFEDELVRLRERHPKLFARVISQLDVIREYGRSSSLKALTDYEDLLEFRVGDLRIVCFHESGDHIVCVSMFHKRSQRDRRIKQKYDHALAKRRKWRNR